MIFLAFFFLSNTYQCHLDGEKIQTLRSAASTLCCRDASVPSGRHRDPDLGSIDTEVGVGRSVSAIWTAQRSRQAA